MNDFEIIPGATDYRSLSNEHIRNYLEEKGEEPRKVSTAELIDRIVEAKLRTNTTNTDAS